MNELLKLILSLSLSGSVLILALLLFKRIVKESLSKRWQYYIWLVVIIRMFLPFTPETSLVGAFTQEIDTKTVLSEAVPPPQQDIISQPFDDLLENEALLSEQIYKDSLNEAKNTSPPAVKEQGFIEILVKNPWIVWLVAALILLIRKITIYQSFIKYIKAGCTQVINIDMLEQMGKIIADNKIKGTVELYTNNLVSTPMMIGFFKPSIILPTADLSSIDFEYILLHELTHYKRGDMFYKWLVQITICIHWFNPLVYLMGNEINRACELSCDEVVIRALDSTKRRNYGDTLLNAIGIGGEYKNSLASVTLGESKKLLKERLESIMKFKKKSKMVISLTVMLTLAVCFCANYVGVYAAPYVTPSFIAQIQTKENIAVKTATKIKNVKAGFSNVAIDINGHVGVEIVKTDKTDVSFEFMNVENEKDCINDAKVVKGIMQISVDSRKAYTPKHYTNYNYSNNVGKNNNIGINNNSSYNNNSFQVNYGPTYKNVIRVHIPNATYKEFKVNSDDGNVHMADFSAPVKANLDMGNFKLIDEDIIQGTYDLNVKLGNLTIEADTIQKEITALTETGNLKFEADSIQAKITATTETGNLKFDVDTIKGEITAIAETGNLKFEVDTILSNVSANCSTGNMEFQINKAPKNLYLDSSDCDSYVKRPSGWGETYTVGNGTPKVTLSNDLGRTSVEA